MSSDYNFLFLLTLLM